MSVPRELRGGGGPVPTPGCAPDKEARLIVIVKLFLSAATACLAVGYAARRRANAQHRPLMAGGVALGWLALGVLLAGHVGLGLPLRLAYWLVELAGGERGAAIVAAVHQSLGVVALLVLTGQAVLGRLRHPLHRPVAWAAFPLWLAVWVGAMFGYV